MFEVEDGNIIIPIDKIIATLIQYDDIIVVDKITVEASGLKKQALTEIGEYICELLSDYSHEYRERWQEAFVDEIRHATGVRDVELDFEGLYFIGEQGMDTIELDFEGYFREVYWDTLSDVSAVYCIYACTYNKAEGNVSIRELLYIGESEQLKTRVKEPDHQGIKRARKKLRDGEVLCLSYAKVDGRSRKRIENALIFEHQPICCIDDKDTYTHETVKIKTFGKNKYLSEQFVVEKGSKVN